MVRLDDIEAAYGFRFPSLYRRVAAAGRLDYGAYGSQWQLTDFPDLVQRPPFLLLGNDYQGISLGNLEAELLELHASDDYRKIPPETLLVPIGRNGAGDMYCLDYSTVKDPTGDGPVPVALAWHDMDALDTLAPTLEDFAFVSLLGAAQHLDETSALTSSGTWRTIAVAHKDLLRSTHFAILTDVYERPARPNRSLINEAEYHEIVHREIGINLADPPSRPYMGNH